MTGRSKADQGGPHGPEAGRSATRTEGKAAPAPTDSRRFSAFYRVKERCYSKSCELSGVEIAVALALASFMNGTASCWPSLETVAGRSRFSKSVVQRALAVLCNGPRPMFSRSHGEHRSVTYCLVTDPARFAEARDKARGWSERPPKTVAEPASVGGWSERPPKTVTEKPAEGGQSDHPEVVRATTRAWSERPPKTPKKELSQKELGRRPEGPPTESEGPTREPEPTTATAKRILSLVRDSEPADQDHGPPRIPLDAEGRARIARGTVGELIEHRKAWRKLAAETASEDRREHAELNIAAITAELDRRLPDQKSERETVAGHSPEKPHESAE